MPAPSRHLPAPLYQQVKTLILREIETGRWRPDDRLPTEETLSVRFRVSKITVRHALRELVLLGLIRREQGRGTFVQPPSLQQGPRELTSFTEEMRRHGLAASSRVLDAGVLPATDGLAAWLRLTPGDAVYRLRRLRLADGEPMGLQTACIPLQLVPGIADIDFGTASLYQVLQSRYSLLPCAARETHRAAAAGDEARLLLLPPGAPVLAAERVTSLADGRPLEYVQSLMRGDRYTVVLDLVKTLRRS